MPMKRTGPRLETLQVCPAMVTWSWDTRCKANQPTSYKNHEKSAKIIKIPQTLEMGNMRWIALVIFCCQATCSKLSLLLGPCGNLQQLGTTWYGPSQLWSMLRIQAPNSQEVTALSCQVLPTSMLRGCGSVSFSLPRACGMRTSFGILEPWAPGAISKYVAPRHTPVLMKPWTWPTLHGMASHEETSCRLMAGWQCWKVWSGGRWGQHEGCWKPQSTVSLPHLRWALKND